MDGLELVEDVSVGADILQAAEAYYHRYHRPISPRWREIIPTVLSDARVSERLMRIEQLAVTRLQGLKLLEIGCSFGVFLRACGRRGIECHGVEPEPALFQTASRLLAAEGGDGRLVCGRGERLPFADATFDGVVSFQVLEHVTDPARVLREAVRVLKPNGFLYCEVPNYHSFWESHYVVFWWPSLPKRIAKWYVRLLGRDVKYLETINYITPGYLRRVFETLPVKVLSWGKELWHERWASDSLPTWGQQARLLALVRVIKRMGVGRLIAAVGDWFDWYYPITVVARKASG